MKHTCLFGCGLDIVVRYIKIFIWSGLHCCWQWSCCACWGGDYCCGRHSCAFGCARQAAENSCKQKETAVKQTSYTISFSLTFVDLCIIVPFIKKNPTRCNNVSNFIIPYLYEAQHVSGDTPPIIRSLKMHWQSLVLHTWKVVGSVIGGRCQARCAWQCPPTTRPTTFHVCKTRGCQCSFRLLMMGGVSPETCWASYKYGIIKFDTLLHLVGFFFMNPLVSRLWILKLFCFLHICIYVTVWV